MKTSIDRILTTHTGSLPRPKPLIDLILKREKDGAVDAQAFEAEIANAVDDVVARQVAADIDVISDGEMSKPSYTTYIRHRVSGIEPDGRAAETGRHIMIGRDMLEHPDFAQQRGNFTNVPFPGCVGELRYKDHSALDRDLAHLKAAADKWKPMEVFMSAPSPGILTRFIINLHYPTEDAYVAALADVMQTEYRAIVGAGFLLQIDAPDLASARNNQYRHLTDDEFLSKIAERNVALLNAATAGLPVDRMRLHICWGNYEGPHTHDLPRTAHRWGRLRFWHRSAQRAEGGRQHRLGKTASAERWRRHRQQAAMGIVGGLEAPGVFWPHSRLSFFRRPRAARSQALLIGIFRWRADLRGRLATKMFACKGAVLAPGWGQGRRSSLAPPRRSRSALGKTADPCFAMGDAQT
jgi:methionine synthase II (cobalamin-independent)